MKKQIIGIDPGVGGASVVLSNVGVLETFKWPDEMGDEHFVDFLRRWKKVDFIVFEKVNATPGMSSKTAGTFIGQYRFMQGVAGALGIPCSFVSPQRWQSVFDLPEVPRCLTPEKRKQQLKNNLKSKAHEIFPEHNWTLATADAALIARYGFDFIPSPSEARKATN